MFAILEPRISGSKAANIVDRLGFKNDYIVEASGFSGGIWLLLNDDNLKLQVVASSKHTITAVVAEGSKLWILTIVYANPNAGIRKNL